MLYMEIVNSKDNNKFKFIVFIYYKNLLNIFGSILMNNIFVFYLLYNIFIDKKL